MCAHLHPLAVVGGAAARDRETGEHGQEEGGPSHDGRDCTPGVRWTRSSPTGSRWGEGRWGALGALGERLAVVAPTVLIMITLVALGLLLGGLLRVIVSRLVHAIGFDRHVERLGLGASLRGAGVLRAPSDVLGLIFFWTTFVVFASLGIDSLGFGGASAFLLAFVPPLFAAVLILIVGWLVANFLSQAS
ncbi:MAG: hypothetical protein FJZ38_03860 [Candidatus Rokubacteria bacterium]|nr:hypothetical protein [Candidatus Rokubacteria bacterium]